MEQCQAAGRKYSHYGDAELAVLLDSGYRSFARRGHGSTGNSRAPDNRHTDEPVHLRSANVSFPQNLYQSNQTDGHRF